MDRRTCYNDCDDGHILKGESWSTSRFRFLQERVTRYGDTWFENTAEWDVVDIGSSIGSQWHWGDQEFHVNRVEEWDFVEFFDNGYFRL